MQRILVTGGAGFIGSCLAEKLAEDANTMVVIVDNLITGQHSKIPASKYNNVRFIKADVNDYSEISTIFHSHSFDYVFHYAALVGVKRTQAHPILVLNDISGINNVLNLSKNTSVKRVFFASSSEVYGEPLEIPQHEHTTPLNSRLPYAIVKNVGEAYLRSYKKEYGLDYTIFRFFNTYGPKQSRDFVISKFIDAALKGNDITVYGEGTQTRTFCAVRDNIAATYKAFKESKFVNDVINIGSEHDLTVLDLAHMVIKLTNSTSKIVHLPPLKEGDMSRRKPNNDNMKTLLGRELMSLEEGLKEVIEYFKVN